MKFGRTMIAEFKAWKTRDEGYGRALGGLGERASRGFVTPPETPAAHPTPLSLLPLPQPVTHLCSHLFRQPWGGVQRRNERGLYKETGVPTVN